MYETVVNKITIKKVSQERSFLAMNITGSKISKLNVPPEVSVTVESDNWPLEMFDACTMGEQLPPRSRSNRALESSGFVSRALAFLLLYDPFTSI